MKRILSLFVLVLLCSTLSSCKEIQQPKVKGVLLEDKDLTDYVEKFEEALEEDLKKEDQWYKVDMLSTSKLFDEEESTDIEVTMKLDGKIKDAEYAFDSKGKLKYTIELNGEVPATKDKEETSSITLKCNIDMTFKEGKNFIKLNLKGKVDKNKFEFSKKTNIEELEDNLEDILDEIDYVADSDILYEFINIDILEDILESIRPEYFIDQIENTIETEETNVYLNKNQYTIETKIENNSDKIKSENHFIMSFELAEDNYQLQCSNQYVHLYNKTEKTLSETTIQLTIKKALVGVVTTPNNEIDYI